MYGLNPRSITSRVARFTYGINTLTTYEPKKSRLEKRVVIDGEEFCEVIIKYFIIVLRANIRTYFLFCLKSSKKQN